MEIQLQHSSVKKKEKGKVKDKVKKKGRAIESLFRTLAKNQYRLMQMIDRKVNVMISANAIILTILIGTRFLEDIVGSANNHLYLLAGTSLLSILFALFTMRPFHLNGAATGLEENKMLNYDVIRSLSAQEYKEKMKQVTQNDEDIYESMTEDIYFIGRTIKLKHILLGISAFFFWVGLTVTMIAMVLPT